MIPLVSGNLSVEWFMKRLLGEAGGPPGSTRGEIEQMAALGFGAVEDYVAWAAVEPREGAFDWSFHHANAEIAKGRGLRYVVYPWLHVVPEWFLPRPEFVPFRCLEHDLECSWPSLFAPSTLDAFRRFYAELRRALGDVIDAICVGFPADYGEAGYPTGIGAWVSRLVPPRDHVHVGFWAGDEAARAAWRDGAAGRPADPDPQAAARDFAGFYVDAMTGFADRLLALVRELFPAAPLWIKVGMGGEALAYGIDPTALVRAAARHGAGVRTTQATLPTLHQKRLATPCRHFAVPFSSEPPVDVGRETVPGRLFDDATSGAVEYFDYPEHMVGARDLMAAHGGLLDGAQSECDVGLLFARAILRRSAEHAMPPLLLDLAEPLRDAFDWEAVDEALIEAGALAPLSVLGLLECDPLADSTQEEIARFVARGGTLVVGPDVEGASVGGELGRLITAAPAADDCVELAGEPAPSMLARLGSAGESLRLAGDWFAREDAGPFRGAPPAGEGARWTGARASAFFPVRRGARHLLEIECWVQPRSAPLERAVLADGTRLGTIRRAGLQRFAAWLEADALRRDVVEIAIESATFRPVELGAGPDTRALGVAVLWLRLTQEGAPADGLADGVAPRVAGRVREAELAERGTLRHGDGELLVSRRRPLATLVALLDHAVRRRSAWGRAAPREAGSGEPLPGLRSTRFPGKVVLWNRAGVERVVELGDDRTRSPIVVPPGALVGYDLRSGRYLGSSGA